MANRNRIRYRRSNQAGVPGEVRMIYSEVIPPETFGDDMEIRRASHVDPTSELSVSAEEWIWENLPNGTLPTGVMSELQEAVYPPNKWWADLLPIGGPVLGPFDKRSQALAAEVDWIMENFI